jgi:hypothetical protein
MIIVVLFKVARSAGNFSDNALKTRCFLVRIFVLQRCIPLHFVSRVQVQRIGPGRARAARMAAMTRRSRGWGWGWGEGTSGKGGGGDGEGGGCGMRRGDGAGRPLATAKGIAGS